MSKGEYNGGSFRPFSRSHVHRLTSQSLVSMNYISRSYVSMNYDLTIIRKYLLWFSFLCFSSSCSQPQNTGPYLSTIITSLLLRFMFAATDLSIAGVVLDSPFANLSTLILELADYFNIRLPKFTVSPLSQPSCRHPSWLTSHNSLSVSYFAKHGHV